MTACLLIFGYIRYELSFDDFHQKAKQTYRIESVESDINGGQSINAFTGSSLGEQLMDDQPQIQSVTRVIPFSENYNGFFRRYKGEKVVNRIYSKRAFFADPNFFQVFDYELLLGDPQTVLSKPGNLLISEDHAMGIFGEGWSKHKGLIGTEIRSGRANLDEATYQISGVFKRTPENSHLRFDVIVSSLSSESGTNIRANQDPPNLYTYVLLEDGTTLEQSRLDLFKSNHWSGNTYAIRATRIDDIHLGDSVSNQPEPNANKQILTFLIAIGIIILIMTWANYINAALISSIYRIKEIGIRKLMGTRPLQLGFTFIGEALLLNFSAATISAFLTIFLLRSIEVFPLLEYPVEHVRADGLMGVAFLLILVVFSSLVSGIYPALLMGKMKPIESLRGSLQVAQSRYSNKSSRVVRSLLVMQLGVVLLFVSALLTVHKQLKYLENNRFSLTRIQVEGIFPGIIGADHHYNNRYDVLYKKLKEQGLLTNIEVSNLYHGQVKNTYLMNALYKPGLDSSEIYKDPFQLFIVDHAYFKNSEDKFLAGESFSPVFSTDYSSVIINESAMHAIGYDSPDIAVNKGVEDVNGLKKISGIIANKTSGEAPKMYKTGLRYPTYFTIDLEVSGTSGERIQEALNVIERRLSFQFPYFYLLDEQFTDLYKSEKETLSVFVSASIVALLIAGIGLFSLSSFTTLKRRQEIGIRKVLGARISDILLILYYDFGLLMFYGTCIALPLIIWGTLNWLSTYQYSISLNGGLIIAPLLATALFILSVVSARCWQSATTNPAQSLSKD